MLLLTIISLFVVFFNKALAYCGSADLTATIGSQSSLIVGEFILSTNKCQAVSALIKDMVQGQSQAVAVNGALILSCDSRNNQTLIIKEYTNSLCAGSPFESSSITIGEDISLFNAVLYFKLNSMVCSDTLCGIDIRLAEDCSGINSERFSNFVVPPNSCQTFVDDFGHNTWVFKQLEPIPYSILPEASVDGLFKTALKFKCCTNDNSLLIYNYSEPNCLSTTNYNTLRLSNEYNGQCFALGNQQKPFDIKSNKANTEDINFNDQVYALRYSWNCDSSNDNDFIDCTDIEFMDTDQIPNVCPDKCLEPGYTLPPTSRPTIAPTAHPISADAGTVTVKPQNIREQNQPFSNVSKYVLIIVIIFVIVVGIVVIALCIYHKRKMKKMVEETKQKQINKKGLDTPMIDVQEPHLINVANKHDDGALPEGINSTDNVNDTESGQYVLPSNITTDGDDTNDDGQNLLSQPLP